MDWCKFNPGFCEELGYVHSLEQGGIEQPLPGGGPSEGERTGPPWENRSQIGSMAGITGTIKEVLFKPIEAFKNMRTEGGLGAPLGFAVLLGTIGGVIATIWSSVLHVGMTSFIGRAGQGQAGAAGSAGLINIVLIPVFIIIGLFIGSGIIHLCLMIVGGANRGFEATFRVLAYAAGATAIWNIIPLLGSFIAGVWAIICEIIGLREAHETTTGKAFFAVFLPLIAGCACGIIILIVAVGGAFWAAGHQM